jgi:hypothetical protein
LGFVVVQKMRQASEPKGQCLEPGQHRRRRH